MKDSNNDSWFANEVQRREANGVFRMARRLRDLLSEDDEPLEEDFEDLHIPSDSKA